MKFFLLSLPSLIIACTAWGQKFPRSTSTGFIAAGEFRIYYEVYGRGPAVLLIHAGMQDNRMWAPQVAALSKTHQVITIDLPYHGNSSGVDTITYSADLVRIIIDSLHLQKLAVAGLSMGATVAQEFAIAYPERVSKAIFISAGVNGYDQKFAIDSLSRSWWPLFSEALKKGDTAAAARVFALTWSQGVKHRDDKKWKAASVYVYKTTLETLKKHRLAGWPRLDDDPPAIDKLPVLKMPVLLVHGDDDLPYITAANRYMETHLPNAKRVEIKGVAHMLNLEVPQKLNAILLKFLKQEDR